MRNCTKDKRFFITVVSVCVLLPVFVSTTPVYASGEIVAWGDRKLPDQPLTNLAQIAGGFHSLGLKTDGSIVAWGGNDYGQLDVPAPNTGFVAVAASGLLSLGLKYDGSIVAWGRNDYGQLDIPAPNTDFIAVAAGGSHNLAIKASRLEFLRGDANTDGKDLDLSDAIFILSYLFAAGSKPTCLDAADANDNGKVGLADAIKILGHVFNNQGPLPEPFSECGIDPTTANDDLDCAAFSPCK